jgi:hypothetical protein
MPGGSSISSSDTVEPTGAARRGGAGRARGAAQLRARGAASGAPRAAGGCGGAAPRPRCDGHPARILSGPGSPGRAARSGGPLTEVDPDTTLPSDGRFL